MTQLRARFVESVLNENEVFYWVRQLAAHSLPWKLGMQIDGKRIEATHGIFIRLPWKG